MQSFGVIDYVILAVVVISALVGLWRGFLREVISLASWIAAIVITILFSEEAALYIAPYVSVPSVRTVIAAGGLFFITLFLGGLVSIIVGQIVKATGLSGTDRVVGFVFGIARGAILVALLILLARLTPLPQDSWWTEAVLLSHFEPLAIWLGEFFPAQLVEQFKLPHGAPNIAPTAPANQA